MEQIILNIINSVLSNIKILLVVFVVFLTLHLLLSFAIRKIAKNKEIKNTWLSFVPIVNTFTIGSVAFKQRIMAYILLISCLLSTVYILDIYNLLGFIFAIITVLISIILYLIAMYNIYREYSKNYIILFILTTITVGLISPIILLFISGNKYIDRR